MTPALVKMFKDGHLGAIELGMARARVVALLGTPEQVGSQSRSGATELLAYRDLEVGIFKKLVQWFGLQFSDGIAEVPQRLISTGSVVAPMTYDALLRELRLVSLDAAPDVLSSTEEETVFRFPSGVSVCIDCASRRVLSIRFAGRRKRRLLAHHS